MDEASIIQCITDTFDDTHIVTADGNTFFFYDPDRKMPFATLVTKDDYDRASNLNRPGVFRLNIGVSPATYRSLFGKHPPQPEAGAAVNTGHDFTALDQLLPHPMYAPMSWVCLLNPSDATFQTVRPLLAEAYDLAVKRNARP
jgi:hypothetical protein